MNDADKLKKLEEQINKLYTDVSYMRHLSKQTISLSTKDKKTITIKI